MKSAHVLSVCSAQAQSRILSARGEINPEATFSTAVLELLGFPLAPVLLPLLPRWLGY